MQAINATDMGSALRSARRGLGMSQQALAEKVGVSRQWVVSAEAGKDTVHLGLMLAALQWVGKGVDVVDLPSTAPLDEILQGLSR
jgi:HTH-type transcriptional regulator/antitoxin HipB